MVRPGFPLQSVMPGTAPTITVREGQILVVTREPVIAGLITVEAIAGLRMDPGQYIVVPMELWANVARQAVEANLPAVEPAGPRLTRQQRRRRQRDLRN